ncbi:hypothetical protein JOQ06_011516, partial [Pogonophryne albipinna]
AFDQSLIINTYKCQSKLDVRLVGGWGQCLLRGKKLGSMCASTLSLLSLTRPALQSSALWVE